MASSGKSGKSDKKTGKPEIIINASQKDNPVDIYIKHVATGRTWKFISTGLRSFQDAFTSNWTSESVYGRQDPIMTFQNTQRSITIEFVVTKSAESQIYSKVKKRQTLSAVRAVDDLARSLYPTYSDKDGALSIKEPPLIRIKFANFLLSKEGSKADAGLLCAVSSYSLDRGQSFSPGTERGAGGQKILPNNIIVSMTLTPLHEFDLGWVQDEGTGRWEFGGSNGKNYYFPTSKITE
jgi:hypothetical protein